jgi:hypothetical protein
MMARVSGTVRLTILVERRAGENPSGYSIKAPAENHENELGRNIYQSILMVPL